MPTIDERLAAVEADLKTLREPVRPVPVRKEPRPIERETEMPKSDKTPTDISRNDVLDVRGK